MVPADVRKQSIRAVEGKARKEENGQFEKGPFAECLQMRYQC